MLSKVIFYTLMLVSVPLLGGELTPDMEKTAQDLENTFIAPCCYRQPVSVHNSKASVEIKEKIRGYLSQGKSKEQIINIFVNEYGERILASPRKEGLGLLAYIIPIAAILLGMVVLTLKGRKLGSSKNMKNIKTFEDGPEGRLDADLKNY